MKGVVVYQSWWGSCRKIADVIGEVLTDSGHDVHLVPVEEASEVDTSLDFLVIGAATRWPGARPKIQRCARKFARALAGKPFAAFSTGGMVFRENSNTQASEVLHDILEKDGMKPLAPPLSIGIEGYKPPGIVKGILPESEIARAEEFAREIAAKLSDKT